MKPNAIIETISLPDGREITIETGKLAKQADGSVVVRMGDTMLLATVVAAQKANEGVDFLPLTVDYREKFFAGGKIPGGFIKRETRPSNEEILTMRLVDRVLRPLFPDDYHAEVQVMISLISYDGCNLPDALAGLAASAAIAVSNIPFNGPISETRVIRIGDQFIVNPTQQQLKEADIELMVGASKDSVIMVEGEMSEVSEQEMLQAIKIAHEAIKDHVAAQEKLAAKIDKAFPKRVYSHEKNDDDLKQSILQLAYDRCYHIAKEQTSKEERSQKFEDILNDIKTSFSKDDLVEKEALINVYFSKAKKEAVRNLILDEEIRLDGRNPHQIRPIWCEVDYLPSTHGSAVFTRGETQSLTAITLGTPLDADRFDNVIGQGESRFYLHYNFPPFSTGEARPLRGTSRREIGHGNLAERALKRMIPTDIPYTIRVVSDILESNGSSSMATVCAGTLALMDAGIQLKKPVSGIAMGLISDQDVVSGRWKVLSDILGDEDHLGDMDFKVTGTRDGITACQMDIKINGLTHEILEKALLQAKEGRLHILDKMLETLTEPRTDLKPHAPRIVQKIIASDFIGAVIGPGGKIIQEIQAKTNTVIVIEEDKDNNVGRIAISSNDPEGIREAIKRIDEICFVPEVGSEYVGTVVSIKDFGAFVSLAKGVEGLVHISELSWDRVNNVEDILKVGDKLNVKLVGYDKGKMRLSHKALLSKPEKEMSKNNAS